MTLAEIRNHYGSLDLVVIGYTLFTEGGDWRSIYLYFRDAQQRGQRVKMIDGKRSDGTKQLMAAGLLAPRVLVNGLNSLLHWPCLWLCLLRSDVYVYLHETAYALDQMERRHPIRSRLIRRVLRKNPLLCVSRQAEQLYEERFRNRRTQVVYECTRLAQLDAFAGDKLHILMTGTLDERKGVKLFSEVAELAAARFPQAQFHWCGASASETPLFRSTRVCWHGWQPTVQPFLERSEIFFLSSVDDP
jgi:glycosyltransferase involved in cell wall biosynthesis